MTTGRGETSDLAAGGPARHVPVLLEAVVAALAPRPGALILDGTFGAGGYTRALLDAGARVIALDRDPSAIAGGQALAQSSGGRLRLIEARFGDVDAIMTQIGEPLDGLTLDIGVSSMQIDEAARGFSFRLDGPLDMRMAQAGRSAADIVNETDEDELADIIFRYGEERQSRRIARAIVADRKAQPFTTTLQLAGLVSRIVRSKPGEIHPATRTFQALRIAVNDELGELERALAAGERALKPGGRLAIVSFHSLEDRIVKQFLAQRSGRGAARSRLLPGETAPPEPSFALVGAQPATADDEEARANPRARSARLRAAQRTSAPAWPASDTEHDASSRPTTARGKRGR